MASRLPQLMVIERQAEVWGEMDRREKLSAAKAQVAAKIAEIVMRNVDDVGALAKAGTFTALLEAYQAISIAENSDVDTPAELAQDVEDYRQGVLRNQEQN